MIRALWDVGEPEAPRLRRAATTTSAAPRAAPRRAHDIAIWIGAYKPRMLRLTGRKADGWLPSLPYLQPGDLAAGNAAIDAAAVAAGREPADDPPAAEHVRRRRQGPPAHRLRDELALALEDGIGTFIVMADDARGHPALRGRGRARRARAGRRPSAGRRPAGSAIAHRPRPSPPPPPRRRRGDRVRPPRRRPDARRGARLSADAGAGRGDPPASPELRRRRDLHAGAAGWSGST